MNVLIIDEDLTLYDLVSQFPYVDSCEVLYSEDTKEILQFIHEFNMQVVILDIDKAKDSGIQLLTELKESYDLLDVILRANLKAAKRSWNWSTKEPPIIWPSPTALML